MFSLYNLKLKNIYVYYHCKLKLNFGLSYHVAPCERLAAERFTRVLLLANLR